MTEQRAPYTVDSTPEPAPVPEPVEETKPTYHLLTLTGDEVSYLWLLTALDAGRLDQLEDGPVRDRHYALRHSVRAKMLVSGESSHG